jgi:hypothetical protein
VEWLSLDSALFYNLEGLGHLPVRVSFEIPLQAKGCSWHAQFDQH